MLDLKKETNLPGVTKGTKRQVKLHCLHTSLNEGQRSNRYIQLKICCPELKSNSASYLLSIVESLSSVLIHMTGMCKKYMINLTY